MQIACARVIATHLPLRYLVDDWRSFNRRRWFTWISARTAPEHDHSLPPALAQNLQGTRPTATFLGTLREIRSPRGSARACRPVPKRNEPATETGVAVNAARLAVLVRIGASATALVAGCGEAVQRARLHLAIDEHAGQADTLADVFGQAQLLRRIEDIDRRRPLFQESRLPAA